MVHGRLLASVNLSSELSMANGEGLGDAHSMANGEESLKRLYRDSTLNAFVYLLQR